MAEPKQILIVDDHFEILEFLRSMLELSNEEYRVLGVPSAEEGLFELRRRPFDLIISDVRLPGMSGFDLVRKVRQLKQDLPVLIITAYGTAQGRQEAGELGVIRYFEKPLDTDTLLATVHTVLYGKQVPAQPTGQVESAQNGGAAVETDPASRRPVDRRLQSLLTDTGAVQVVVADRQGATVARVGERRSLNLAVLTQLVAKNLDTSFLLGEQLQSREPFAIQYQAGETVDLYFANIERDHFIMLLFDVQERRGRIGTVWIFTQRAIKDLKSLLPVDARGVDHKQDTVTAPVEDSLPVPEAPVVDEPERVEPPNPEPEPEMVDAPAVAPEETEDAEIDAMPEDPALSTALDGASRQDEVDLDAFWEEAANDMGSDADGLSFEEAVRRGLLPPEFGEIE